MSRPGTSSKSTERVDPAAGDQVTELMESYAALLLDTAQAQRRLSRRDLALVRTAGARAAAAGMSAGAAVDLFLSAAASAWGRALDSGDLATTQHAARSMLEGIRGTTPVLMDGYQTARRPLIRFEETQRREFIDDLLRGDADLAGLVQRAEPFGLDFSRPHQVVMARPRDDHLVTEHDESRLERAVVDQYGDREVLVTTKGGYLIALVPNAVSAEADDPAAHLAGVLNSGTRSRPWRVAAGRSYPGGYGIPRSYEEAREAIILAERLHPDSAVIRNRDLLIYRVLSRDRVAITDLVRSVLTPLTTARGGADPLLATLEGYFAHGEVATVTARALHLSVRTVTYRLAKIAVLTQHDPADPTQRYILQTAVLGARVLNWPTDPLDQ